MKSIILFLLIVLAPVNKTISQEVISTTGGEASGSEGLVSYTVGQVFYTTNTGSTGSIEQGIQHAYSISVETGVEETSISLSISAYPNPTADFFTLKMNAVTKEHCTISVYHMNGQLEKSQQIEGNETQINMSGLPPSTYILKVTQKKDSSTLLLKSFKVIKTN